MNFPLGRNPVRPRTQVVGAMAPIFTRSLTIVRNTSEGVRMANNFLEQIKRAREAAERPTPEPEKPIEPMTDEELEEAERTARRELLDVQHQELREREITRVAGPGEAEQGRTLTDVLREKQAGKRRTWR